MNTRTPQSSGTIFSLYSLSDLESNYKSAHGLTSITYTALQSSAAQNRVYYMA